MEVPQVGSRTVLHLPGSPNLCSVGELVEEGWKFLWDNSQVAELMRPDGTIIQCHVDNRVPTVSVGLGTNSTGAEQPSSSEQAAEQPREQRPATPPDYDWDAHEGPNGEGCSCPQCALFLGRSAATTRTPL